MDTEGAFRTSDKENSFDASKENIQEPKSRPAYNNTTFTETGRRDRIIFWLAVGASQGLGVICVALAGYWCKINGGFGWEEPWHQMLFHPFLMILGLIFFYGDAILVYRVLHFLPKWILKCIHGALHMGAIVMSSVALTAVFENHRKTDKADMYSLHSWVGITTFAFFCLQYVLSFITFVYPGLPPSERAKIMPFHTFFGVGVFILAVATALMGLTEYLFFNPKYGKGLYVESGTVGNTLGLFLVAFAFVVTFLATQRKYKRIPLPTD